MPTSLPLDIIDLILSYLGGTASIADCALVCHSWLPSARYHLLPWKALYLDEHIKAKRFLSLLHSPDSTLFLLPVKKLSLAQEYDSICEDSIVGDLLASDFISFRLVTSLDLCKIKWRTLSPSAVASLHSNFTSVKKLLLGLVSLTFSDFCSLIFALKTLEELTISFDVEIDAHPSFIDTVRRSHPSLRSISDLLLHTSTIQFFARGISYASGITTLSHNMYYEIEQLKAFGELLETAGTNLRVLELRVLSCDPAPGADDVFSELLALRHNPNLQEIDIGPASKSTLMLLLQGLKMNTKPNLCRLKLQLELYEHIFDWTEGPLVDEALSPMLLEDPKLTIHLTAQPIRWCCGGEESRKTYLQKSLAKLKELLPRTAQCWTLEVGLPSARFMYLQSTPSEIKVSNINCNCNQ